MQKKKFKKLTFLPKYDIGPDLAEYVSTYAALLKFSKRTRAMLIQTKENKISQLKDYLYSVMQL